MVARQSQRPDESGRGTQECVRHVLEQGGGPEEFAARSNLRPEPGSGDGGEIVFEELQNPGSGCAWRGRGLIVLLDARASELIREIQQEGEAALRLNRIRTSTNSRQFAAVDIGGDLDLDPLHRAAGAQSLEPGLPWIAGELESRIH